jgi:hypothetical protein
MSWTISDGQSGGTSVTLPTAPSSITDDTPIIDSGFQVNGMQSLVVSEGLDIRVLTLKGFISGSDKSTLDSLFIELLQELNRTVVTLACPTSRYNGVWLFNIKTVEEKAEGNLARYTYTMILKQGADFIIL